MGPDDLSGDRGNPLRPPPPTPLLPLTVFTVQFQWSGLTAAADSRDASFVVRSISSLLGLFVNNTFIKRHFSATDRTNTHSPNALWGFDLCTRQGNLQEQFEAGVLQQKPDCFAFNALWAAPCSASSVSSPALPDASWR